ncbi:hypothetical protein TIFTF001_031600 [Ficus carica]|uniref:Uncharacterized protein n=1 Tax=Ficus carica TaxID=3494 RepID=A0AA88DV15_FICCA|nr:hypothetical protein TIFTF001_031600 [Ficus carica]
MIAGLGGLRFGEIEEGKDCGFNGTFRLFTLAVVVIFLFAAFPMLSPSLVGALLSRAWCMLVFDVSRYFPVFGPQTCAVPTVC